MARIAIVQRAPVFLNRAATLAIAVAAVEEAALAGARLVVFSEAFVPGYPAWLWRLRPGNDMGLTERLHARLRADAVDLDGDDLTPLREAAARREVTVVCGLNERSRAFGGGTLYNSAVVIGADGGLANRHRKLMPTNPSEKSRRAESARAPMGHCQSGPVYVSSNRPRRAQKQRSEVRFGKKLRAWPRADCPRRSNGPLSTA